MSPNKNAIYPFLLGAQYYRAPTPEEDCWEIDHQKMHALGFNAVKYWIQWRWSHRQESSNPSDIFIYDDVDRLMELAKANNLQVTINTIFDVAPSWLYERFPDAKQVMCNGHFIEPYTVAHRQIGGHPGPCYNHPGALTERKKFLQITIEHFRDHPALAMWDVWNEPELSFPQRNPQVETMACYCQHCQSGFIEWLQQKYQDLDGLNQVWGRCYQTWEQVEVPRNPHTITDYIDWREFHIHSMTREAEWRLQMVAELDPGHIRYLHVVPNVMSIFNSVSCCADDFEMANLCQVFAATMNGGPVYAPQVISAARGKLCYNVESHVNFGMTNMHQRVLTTKDLLQDWLPQIGQGIRGFLFWQYRPEVLGFESPAWGLVNLDGSDRPVTIAVKEFWQKIKSISQELLDCPPSEAEIGIWKSRKNEIFHFCIHQNLESLIQSVEGYIQALYWGNHPYRIISGEMLAAGDLGNLKLLILPSPYYLTEEEAAQLDTWVRSGGVLISEAHLGGYNGTTGRHSRCLPGCGLSQAWDIQEINSTSSYHLKLDLAESFLGTATEDVRKALQNSSTSGGKYFPIKLPETDDLQNPRFAWGADRYTVLQGIGLQPEGWFEPGVACLVSKKIGEGSLIYAGTNLGMGTAQDDSGLREILQKAISLAGVCPTLEMHVNVPGQVHLDSIKSQTGKPQFLIVQNRSNKPIRIETPYSIKGNGLFTGWSWESTPGQWFDIPEDFIDLIVLKN